MTAPCPYGGISRADRIDQPDGPWCDKAWHLSGEDVRATSVLRCAYCGRKFARCAACNRRGHSAADSMRGHLRNCKARRDAKS
jgi:hypothetical protein